MSSIRAHVAWQPRRSDRANWRTTKWLVVVCVVAFECLAATSLIAQVPLDGGYPVGHRQFLLTDPARQDRPLVVDMWYPGRLADDSQLTTYQVASSVDFSFPSQRAYAGIAVDDSQPFPLLISSHGTTLYSTSQASVNETLASHGFVVVAPNHTGNSRNDIVTGKAISETAVARDRLLDVPFLIDTYLAASGQVDGVLSGATIDPERIGVMGLSYGGVTSFAAHLGAMDIPADPRIKAIMPITAGGFQWMGMSTRVLKATIPTLLVSGTLDITLGGNYSAFDAIVSDQRFLARIDKAEHLSYADICEWRDYAQANSAPASIRGFLDSVALAGGDFHTCIESVIDNQPAIDLTGQLGVAFFRTFLNGEVEYRKYLTDDYFHDSELPVQFIERGDFTRDGQVNAVDLDRIHVQIARSRQAASYDVNRDGMVDRNDVDELIHVDLRTYYGDANLDGEFNSSDLVKVFEYGLFEIGKSASWSSGDWNGDGQFDSSDFVLAFDDGGYEQGPRAATHSVPEPTMGLVAIIAYGLLSTHGSRRRTEG